VHLGLALHPYLFCVVVNEVTKDMQDKVSSCVMFADDIVFVAENKEEVNNRLNNWQ